MSKISELSDGGVIQGGDTLIAVRSGGNVKVTYGGTTTANIDGGTIDGTTIGGTTPAAGSFTTGSFTGNVSFGDNDKAIFGAGSDLQIWHAGDASYIGEVGTGNLIIYGDTNIDIQNAAGQKTFRAESGGPAYLYHANNLKLATTSAGIDVTGTVTADGLTVDASTSQMITLNHSTPSNLTTLGQDSSGDFRVRSDSVNKLKSYANGDFELYEDTGTTAKLFWDASAESLGIGTSSPTAGLECINTEGAIVARSTQSSNTNVSLRFAGGAYSGNKATAILLDGVSGENNLYLGGGTSFGEPATDIRFHTGSAGAVGTGSERMRIDSSGNVDLYQGNNLTWRYAAGSTIRGSMSIDSADNITFSNTSSNTERMRIGSTGIIYVNGDGIGGRISGDGSGALVLQDGNGRQSFKILSPVSGSAQAMTLDASGNLLVGTTSESTWESAAGFRARQSGSTTITRDGNPPLYVNRLSSDGTLLQFQKGTAVVGSIQSRSGVVSTIILDPRSGQGAGLTGAGAGGDTLRHITPTNESGTEVDGKVSLGNSNNGFKDLYLSGGVYVGGTGSANKLDDYEEGTWTGTLTGSSTAPSTAQTATGTYTKVGNLVTVNIGFSNKDITGASGNAQITGLPFTCGDNAQGAGWNSRVGSGTDVKIAYIGSDNNIVWVNGHGTSLAWSTTGTGTYVGVTITFMVA